MEKTIPKDPQNVDLTLDAVLKNVKFNNKNDIKLKDYAIKATEVVLTYDDTD